MRRPTLSAALTVLTVLGLLATPPLAAHHHRSASGPNLVQAAAAAGTFETLIAALQAAELVGTLEGAGPFTVFAPTDDAFAALPAGTVESLLEPANRDALRAVLTYHVAAGELPASAAGSRRAATTVNGQRLELRVEEGRLRVDEATVVAADVRASNGILHVIDRVLLPEDKSLVALAQGADTFDTLLAAARAAGLAETLSEGGPFTLFAPTDEAFDRLPEGTLDSLLEPEGLSTLERILTYHVVEGRVFSDQALAAGRARTLAGDRISIGVSDGRLRVNESGIVATDLDAANGVVHVIDQVLLPPDIAAGTPEPDRLIGRSAAAAERVIRLAIERGVPLFNSGDAGACAAIYEVAATSLLEGAYELPSPARQALDAALREAARAHGDRARAWALRHGLDAAMRELRGGMASRTH